MAYTKVNWVDGSTPENALTLGQMDQGILDAHAGLPPTPVGQEGKWIKSVSGAMVWSAIAQADVTGLTATLAGKAAVPGYGTSLPGSPVDGQEYVLVNSLTAPTYQWHFRYNAGSSSAYKWEFIGGPPAFSDVQTAESLTNTTYAALPTDGPSIVVPRAGDYRVQFMAESYNSTAATAIHHMAIRRGAAGTSDADSAACDAPSTNVSTPKHARDIWLLNATASMDIHCYYKTSVGTANFRKRELRVTPIRVS